jgi:hypothetical protein
MTGNGKYSGHAIYIFFALFRKDWKNEQPEAFKNLKTLIITVLLIVHHSDHKKLINKKSKSFDHANEP